MAEKNDLELAIETMNRKEFKGRVLTLERGDQSRLPTGKANASTSNVPAVPTLISPSTDPKAKKRAGDEKRQIVSSKLEEDKSREKTTREKREIRGNGSRHKESERRRTENPHRSRVVVDRDRAFNDRRRHVAPATNSRDRPLLRGYASQGHRGTRPPTRGFRGGFGRAVSSRAISQRVSYPERESATTSSRFGSRQSSSLRANNAISSRQLEELLRLKEQESERKVREMQLTMERERIRYENEKLERKRLQLQLMASQTGSNYSGGIAPSESSRSSRDHRGTASRISKDRHSAGGNSRDLGRHATRNDSHSRESSRHHVSSRHERTEPRSRPDTSRARRDSHHSDRRDAPRYGSASYTHSSGGGRVYESSQGSSRDYHGAGVSSTGYPAATLSAISGYGTARNMSGLPAFDTSGFSAGATSGFAWPTVSNPTIQARTTFKNSDYTFAGSSDLSGGRNYEYTRRY